MSNSSKILIELLETEYNCRSMCIITPSLALFTSHRRESFEAFKQQLDDRCEWVGYKLRHTEIFKKALNGELIVDYVAVGYDTLDAINRFIKCGYITKNKY